jgi:hypothetical protein
LAARPIPVAVCFLCAITTPEEREAVAQAHDAQAEQLRGLIPATLARVYLELQQLWHAAAFRAFGPTATVAQVLTLASPEQVERIRGDLAAAGIDPDTATSWRHPPGPRACFSDRVGAGRVWPVAR